MRKYIKKILLFLLLIIFLGSLSFISKAQEEERDPIIIIPGIMGSWNWDVMINDVFSDNWDFFALDHTFDNLIQALEDEGFEKDKNLFIAFYDWRQNNASSSQNYLIPIIDKALVINASSTKVDIISHSMGGLVARSYIQGENYRNDVDQFIMLGTPNYGSSDVYTLWEGGEVPDNWPIFEEHIIKFYAWYITTQNKSWYETPFLSQTDYYDTIHKYIPSVQELLPTYDYLVDKESEAIKPVAEMAEQNSLLNDLNSESGISNLLTKVAKTTVIAGNGESTVKEIPVVERDPEETKLWVDGIPEPNPPVRDNADGDNRVLLASAFLEEPGPPLLMQNNLPDWLIWVKKFTPSAYAGFWDPFLDQLTLDSRHGDLPTIGIDRIFGTLALSPPAAEFIPIPDPAEIVSFWFASPIEVKIIDPDGNIITKDINEINGAIYDGEDNPAGVKMVIIIKPKDGDYKVELIGLEEGGDYHMAAAYFGDSGDIINTVGGTIASDERIGYTVAYNSSNLESPIEISEPYGLEEENYRRDCRRKFH